MTTNAAAAGQFKILGKHLINRLGYGAMRITGKGIWGPPADRALTALLTQDGYSVKIVRPMVVKQPTG